MVDLIDTIVYAERLKDKSALMGSSSGGAFTALSDFFLKNGNAVMAAIYNYENHTAEFKMILDEEQRERAKGSKYMQSKPGDIYRKAYHWLMENPEKELLFVGIGCQSDGFRKFSEIKGIRDRVYIVDIICHGSPSPKLWREYAESIQKKDGKITYLTFKDKRNGWKSPTAYVKINGAEKPIKDYVKVCPIKATRAYKGEIMNTTLLIMAAGIGSRFGTGIKQLEPVDDANHIIMDYSIHDAIEAGFNHVVFIIRKDIEKEFKEVIGDRIAAICSSHNVTVNYAFQDINDIPGELPAGRTKPWGTGQAVLAAKKVIKTPFIVINADDYYGKEGFKAVHDYLVNGGKSCMAGFVLKNTLSDNGGVTRGICKMDENGNLTEVVETKNIVKTTNGAEADGVVVDVNSLVSMNMWGLTPEFLDVLEEGFKEFFEKEVPSNPQKAEYLIPIFIGELLEQGKMSVKVLKTNDTWYGMTYHEDVAAVKNSFKKMLENGVYKADLFSDL